MISALAYLIAIVMTIGLAVILYPIAGFFWILGLFGKIADGIFFLTRKMINAMWDDVKNMGVGNNTVKNDVVQQEYKKLSEEVQENNNEINSEEN